MNSCQNASDNKSNSHKNCLDTHCRQDCRPPILEIKVRWASLSNPLPSAYPAQNTNELFLGNFIYSAGKFVTRIISKFSYLLDNKDSKLFCFHTLLRWWQTGCLVFTWSKVFFCSPKVLSFSLFPWVAARIGEMSKIVSKSCQGRVRNPHWPMGVAGGGRYRGTVGL